MSGHRIIWLASFPKSGNTWMRAFLANYFIGGKRGLSINALREFTTGDIRADFYDRAAGGTFRIDTIDDYLALRPKALRLIHDARDGHHFVKTHHQSIVHRNRALIPPELTAAAIYIIRNPFDVVPSYARHSDLDLDGAIAAMIDRDHLSASPRGLFEIVGSWSDHVASWTESDGLAMHVSRYEDLRSDPKKGFSAVLDFLRVPVDPPKLRQTLKLTSLDALRKQERREGFVERPQNMEAFFHSGRIGGWRDTLSEAQIGRVFEAFEPTIRQWYPELVEDVAAIAGRAGA